MFSKEFLVRFFKEWGIFALIISVLYFTGLYTEVAGGVQRVMLMTGLMDASETIPVKNQTDVNFDFSLQNSSNESINFKKFKGKVVFVNVWATWCPPCRAEMPEIQELYDQKKEDVSFVMISLDKNFKTAKQFVKDKAFTFPIYSRIDALPTEFQSQSIPATFVVSANGKLIFRKEGIADYNNEEFIKLLEQAQ